MKQLIKLGPIAIRIGWRGVAKWGYPVIEIGGLTIGSRHSDGALGLLGYHPRTSTTWHWSISITRRQAGIWEARPFALWSRMPAKFRRSQWHDYYRLPFGYSLAIARQDYHLEGCR